MVPATTRLRALAVHHPLAFAALWFAINLGLLRAPALLPGGSAILCGALSLAASLVVTLALLMWLGWLGVAYAAFGLRTRTLWQLIAIHACSDIAIASSRFAIVKALAPRSPRHPSRLCYPRSP